MVIVVLAGELFVVVTPVGVGVVVGINVVGGPAVAEVDGTMVDDLETTS